MGSEIARRFAIDRCCCRVVPPNVPDRVNTVARSVPPSLWFRACTASKIFRRRRPDRWPNIFWPHTLCWSVQRVASTVRKASFEGSAPFPVLTDPWPSVARKASVSRPYALSRTDCTASN